MRKSLPLTLWSRFSNDRFSLLIMWTIVFRFSVLEPFKPNELLVLCFVTLHTLILSCPHLCSEHVLKRIFGPTGSLLYFLCFLLSPTSEVSLLPVLTLPLQGLPSRQGSWSQEMEVCSEHCRPTEREEGSTASHTCAPGTWRRAGLGTRMSAYQKPK